MHPVLMTLVALGINSGDGHVQSPKIAPKHAHAAPCDACGPAGCVHGHGEHRAIKKAMRAAHNMMPQSCYEPSFGCYAGSRFMNRYPAFHGSYYRRPYNYRNVFDYPWHADMHEPTSLFSYNTVRPTVAPTTEDAPVRAIQPSTTLRRTEEETIELQPIGTGVKENDNPFRSASATSDSPRDDESVERTRRRTSSSRRGSIARPQYRR